MSPDSDSDGRDPEFDEPDATPAEGTRRREPVLVGDEPLPETGAGSLASVFSRGTARFTDLVLSLLVPGTVILTLFGEETLNSEGEEIATLPEWAPLLLVGILAAYEIGLVAWRGQTVGMMVGRIEVIRRSDGRPPRQQDAARRAALPIMCIALGFVVPIFQLAYIGVYVSPIFERGARQGWHDRMGGTLVVRTR